MSRVKGRDTLPEKQVRSLLFGLGYRFRLHSKTLPGKPDIVLRRFRKVIFVHGCFWHGHACAAGANRPRSNQDYWLTKLDRNKARDQRNQADLRKLGWKTLTIWECELKKAAALQKKIVNFLES